MIAHTSFFSRFHQSHQAQGVRSAAQEAVNARNVKCKSKKWQIKALTLALLHQALTLTTFNKYQLGIFMIIYSSITAH